MTKLHELLGKAPLKGAHVGIEIEAEGSGMKEVRLEQWNSTDDGSLRGEYPHERHEFVSLPLPWQDVPKALDALVDSQKEAKFDFSFRTSSHVHVNCTDMTVEAVAAFAYTYFLLERDLMRYCGEHRNNNRFCLRMVDSDLLGEVLQSLIQARFREMRMFINEDMRYGACNMASLSKYGTLEFRGMRGTLDKEVLLNWIGALISIREYAILKGNAWEVYSEAVKDSENFHKNVLGDYTKVFIEPDAKFNLAEALSLTVEIPFTAREMLAREEPRPKKVEKAIVAKRQNPWEVIAAHANDANHFQMLLEQQEREFNVRMEAARMEAAVPAPPVPNQIFVDGDVNPDNGLEF